jgi:hypothetical protein
MRNHWNCSKVADFIRGVEKPQALTCEDWSQWHKSNKNANKFRYWLAEKGLSKLQDIYMYIPDKLDNIRYYINNRWISKSHSLTAHPRNIKPGEWCDVGNRFLPCLFNELVDFVEVEQAWHHTRWDKEARKKYNTPWYRTTFFRLRVWRCPEAGLDYLKWASELTDEEWLPEDKKHLSQPTAQALAAREILELYHWWKEVYPNRPDIYDISGFNQYLDNLKKNNTDSSTEKDSIFLRPTDPKLIADRDLSLRNMDEIEKKYKEEDEEMMIRLIRIRDSLWT